MNWLEAELTKVVVSVAEGPPRPVLGCHAAEHTVAVRKRAWRRSRECAEAIDSALTVAFKVVGTSARTRGVNVRKRWGVVRPREARPECEPLANGPSGGDGPAGPRKNAGNGVVEVAEDLTGVEAAPAFGRVGPESEEAALEGREHAWILNGGHSSDAILAVTREDCPEAA